jgi:hypothetical protein
VISGHTVAALVSSEYLESLEETVDSYRPR